MNLKSESEGLKGEWSRSNAKRMSLKFVSHVVKENDTAVVKTMVQRSSKRVKIVMTKTSDMNLYLPLGIFDDM